MNVARFSFGSLAAFAICNAGIFIRPGPGGRLMMFVFLIMLSLGLIRVPGVDATFGRMVVTFRAGFGVVGIQTFYS